MHTGIIGTRPGTIMAASDRFEFVVRGLGGHGALPHTTRDPVVAAAAVVTALQTLVSRETSPVDAAVVTVSRGVWVCVGGDGVNFIFVVATHRGYAAELHFCAGYTQRLRGLRT